jgi:hypothetical protein
MQTLSNAWQTFADNNLAEPVADLADAINSVDPEQFQRWLELGKNLALIGAGMYGLGKLRRAMGSRGKRGGAAGGAGGLGGGMGAPVPVYVVNQMGMGGGPGGAGRKGKAGSYGQTGRKATYGAAGANATRKGVGGAARRVGAKGLGALRLGSKALGPASMVVEAGLGGYAIGSVINEGIDLGLSKLMGKQTSLGSLIYEMTHDPIDMSTPVIKKPQDNATQEVGGELRITIDSEGMPRVTGLAKRGPMDLTVNTGRMMGDI